MGAGRFKYRLNNLGKLGLRRVSGRSEGLRQQGESPRASGGQLEDCRFGELGIWRKVYGVHPKSLKSCLLAPRSSPEPEVVPDTPF